MRTDLEKFKSKMLDLQIATRQSENPLSYGTEERAKIIRRCIRLERELVKMYKEK